MTEKLVLEPTADHPITVTPNPNRVVVTVAGKTVADSRNALTLQEASYPAVQYIPLADVDESLLERTDHESYCPFKGDASYFSIPAAGSAGENAVWQYQHPYPSVAPIQDRVAFYADRVQVTVQA